MINKIFCFVIGMMTLSACSDNIEDLSHPSAKVVPIADFVDVRDGNTYKCVQIGNQIWTVENLRYLVPGGPISGCFTWGLNKEKANPDNIVPNITFDEAASYITKIYADPEVQKAIDEMIGYQKNALLMLPINIENGIFTKVEQIRNTLISSSEFVYRKFMACVPPEKINAVSDGYVAEQEVQNGYYSKSYGYLYSYDAALDAVPDGWRLPTDDDFKQLETALGLSADECDRIEAWRGSGLGTYLTSGPFAFQFAGGNLYTSKRSDFYTKKDEGGYYWTSTIYKEGELESDSTALDNLTPEMKEIELKQRRLIVVRQFAVYSNAVWRGSYPQMSVAQPVTMSVRLVKDVK